MRVLSDFFQKQYQISNVDLWMYEIEIQASV